MIIFFILFLALFLRLFKLDDLPAEMWGDVIEHYKMTSDILRGNLFWNYRFGGDGPLISYLNAALTKLFGLSFYSLKLTTVLLGVLLTALVHFYTMELFRNKKIGYIASFLTAVSFWSLSFSRQAKPHILIPVFVVLTLFLILKKRKILAGLVFGLGMFSQAGFWGMPVIVLFSDNLVSLATGFLVSAPLIRDFIADFSRGVGKNAFFWEKLGGTNNLNFLDFFFRIAVNFTKNLLSLFIRGDKNFRHTIPGQPHLDLIVFIFFLIGLGFLIRMVIKRKDMRLINYLFLPLIFLQIPSILDISNPNSLPNMGRMIAVMPFLYVVAAVGLAKIANKIALIFFLFVILAINFYQYFYVYPKFLPDSNIPFGKIIARKIDDLPNDYKIVVLGCCWGQWGQPEPNGIRFQLRRARRIIFYAADDNQELFSCGSLHRDVKKGRIAVFYSPKDLTAKKELNHCLSFIRRKLLTAGSVEIVGVVEGSLF